MKNAKPYSTGDRGDSEKRIESLMQDLPIYCQAMKNGIELLTLLQEAKGGGCNRSTTRRARALLQSLKLATVHPIESLGEEIDLILQECK